MGKKISPYAGQLLHQNETLVKVVNDLMTQIAWWKRLYLDQPEDRLFHAKDQTWWQRIDGTYLGDGALYKAPPPEYVQKLTAENEKLKRQIKKLKSKLERT